MTTLLATDLSLEECAELTDIGHNDVHSLRDLGDDLKQVSVTSSTSYTGYRDRVWQSTLLPTRTKPQRSSKNFLLGLKSASLHDIY